MNNIAVKTDGHRRVYTMFLPVAVALLLVGLLIYGLKEANSSDRIRIEDGTAIVQEAISIIEAGALLPLPSDWDTVKRGALSHASGSVSESDVDQSIGFLVGSLKDQHSVYLSRKRLRLMQKAVSSQSMTEIATLSFPEQGIAVIKIYSYLGIDDQSSKVAAHYIRSLANEAIKKGYCGTVIDLTAHSGGNMWPAVYGLLNFLSDGTVGYFENARAGLQPISTSDGLLRYDALTQLPGLEGLGQQNGAFRSKMPVAILQGENTASSGEMVALFFKAQDGVKSFGRPTAGQTTGNEVHGLSHGGALALASHRVRDRTLKLYEGAIQPDRMVEASSMPSVMGAAIEWIRESCNSNSLVIDSK